MPQFDNIKNLDSNININELPKSSYEIKTRILKNGEKVRSIYFINKKKENDEYYLKNKDHLKEKLLCECNKKISRYNFSLHKKSSYHLKFISNKNDKIVNSNTDEIVNN